MQIQCVHCGKQYSLRDENVGSQFLCRSCKKLSPVPVRAPEESAVVAPLAPIAARPAEPAAGPIETECQHCGKQYKLKSAAAGMQFKCKQCGGLTPVGAPAPLPPPQAIKTASPNSPLAPQPARRALSAIPQAARPAPPARQAAATPLAARPLARTARPASAPPQALPAGLVEAELVASPADLLASASPYAVAAPESRPLPPAPLPNARRKQHRKRSDSGSSVKVVLRVLGGAALLALGIGLMGFTVYAITQTDARVRRPGKVIFLGICLCVTGFGLMLGRNKKEE
jgi:hypothetical protein